MNRCRFDSGRRLGYEQRNAEVKIIDHGVRLIFRLISSRRATLTDAESQQVLQYLAGFSPVALDMAIAAVKALQLHRDSG